MGFSLKLESLESSNIEIVFNYLGNMNPTQVSRVKRKYRPTCSRSSRSLSDPLAREGTQAGRKILRTDHRSVLSSSTSTRRFVTSSLVVDFIIPLLAACL